MKRRSSEEDDENDQRHQDKQESLEKFCEPENFTLHCNDLQDRDPTVQYDMIDQKVAILDCGAQYGKVIDRRVRELCIESVILPINTKASELINVYKAVIISGGPKSVCGKDALKCDPELFSCGIPILGICYGLQLINHEFGGTVEKKAVREDGEHLVAVDQRCLLFQGLDEKETVLLTHGDSIGQVAPNFCAVAWSESLIVAIANEVSKIYGVQFHPEVDLTQNGTKMLENFLYKIAQCSPTFTMKSREHQCLDELKKIDQNRKILVLCSGGVDSTVLAAMLQKVTKKENLFAIHIDNGFMRHNESHLVAESLKKVGVDLKVYKYDRQFYTGTTDILNPLTGELDQSDQLCSTCDPEKKRRIIGDTFMKLTKEIMLELKLDPDEVYIAQGTLRPDLIESASSLVSHQADAIKTHHNDTEMVRNLRARGLVVEPLKDFHKDEVRALGRDLGLPEQIVSRHPFPGPGLAIRILCRLEPYFCNNYTDVANMLKKLVEFSTYSQDGSHHVNKIRLGYSEDELNLLLEISSKFSIKSTLLPIQAVGVQGDARTYSYVVALSTDHEPIPWTQLFILAKMIPKVMHNINRVTYLFGSALQQSHLLDITPTLLTSLVIAVARKADEVANRNLVRMDLLKNISQMPVVIIPVHFDRDLPIAEHPSVRYSVCLRPFITRDFMTGIAAVPDKHLPSQALQTVVNELLQEVPYLSRVLYDLTSKPPATTEWE